MIKKRPIPVYIFTGFLDSGKTKFICDSLKNPDLLRDKTTLLIVCEEGEEEYDPTEFASSDVYMVKIESEEELSRSLLDSFTKERNIDQIMLEYNGMWELDKLYKSFPEHWGVVQEFAFFDANTILSYNTNMRAQTVDKLKSCDLAVFNRVGPDADIMPFHKLVRGISRNADIVYDRLDGRVERDEIEDPLPFDVNAPIIEIEDRDFALWYRDMGEKLMDYENKTVKFKAMIAKNAHLKSNEMVAGRKVMTCCADDIAYTGLVCEYSAAELFDAGTWAIITAKIEIKKHPLYNNKGPVLNVITASRTGAPEDEVATFY